MMLSWDEVAERMAHIPTERIVNEAVKRDEWSMRFLATIILAEALSNEKPQKG